MNIGLLTTGFPRFEGDHCGAFLLTLARGLCQNGHQVRVLAPEPDRPMTAPRWPDIEVRWVPYARPRFLQTTFYRSGAPDNLRAHPARWLGAATFTTALLGAARPLLDDCDALVSSWCIPSGWVGSTVADGRDHLCVCHASDVRWLSKAPARREIARRIVDGATSLWFLSTEQRQRFFDAAELSASLRPTHLGSMPIELPRALGLPRSALRQQLGIEGFTLLFIGRLVRDKGVDQLILAAARLGRPVALRIAGDGPERGSAEALARRLGVDATFEGWVSGDRKEALLQACDGLVVPSRAREGLPTVLFEARRRSLPIIATRVGDIETAVGTRTLLVPPDRPAALADAIGVLRAEAQGVTRSVPFGGR